MMFVRRILILLAAVALAGAVVVSAERSRPGYTALGQALDVSSDESRLAAAADAKLLHGTQPTRADLALARRAAVSAPLSALPFYLLGTNGQVRDPAAAVGEALRRDPRFRPAYTWQAEHDARSGDIAGATRAMIRLATLTQRETRYWAAIVQLTADPAARAVIKREMARTPAPAWRDGYLTQLGASSVDRGIVFEMLQSSGRRAATTSATPLPAALDDRRAFIDAMVVRKDYERAYLAWVQWLPAASQGAVGHVFDSRFKGATALPPFAWALSNGVGGATAIDAASGLTLDYSGTEGATLAQQMLLLAPGTYRIATEARFDALAADGGTPPLVWTLTCIADQHVLNEIPVPLEGTPKRAGGAPFAVPADCPAQTLALRVNPADFAKRISGSIRGVTVEAVR